MALRAATVLLRRSGLPPALTFAGTAGTVTSPVPRAAPGLSLKRGHVQSDRPLSTAAFPRGGGRVGPRLRTHAVSILDGDYSDQRRGGDTGMEEPFPADDQESDWHVSPADAPTEDDYDEDVFGGGVPRDSEGDLEMQERLLKKKRAEEAKRERWAENAKPHVRVRELDERGRAYGRGSRKDASASVWIYPGSGVITVNNRSLVDYFPRESHREHIISPFVATRTTGSFDLTCDVEGGGLTGKAGAIRHGLARALEKYNPDYRPPMKRLGYMTRDPRMVERKKTGRKKARKSPQWVRR